MCLKVAPALVASRVCVFNSRWAEAPSGNCLVPVVFWRGFKILGLCPFCKEPNCSLKPARVKTPLWVARLTLYHKKGIGRKPLQETAYFLSYFGEDSVHSAMSQTAVSNRHGCKPPCVFPDSHCIIKGNWAAAPSGNCLFPVVFWQGLCPFCSKPNCGLKPAWVKTPLCVSRTHIVSCKGIFNTKLLHRQVDDDGRLRESYTWHVKCWRCHLFKWSCN